MHHLNKFFVLVINLSAHTDILIYISEMQIVDGETTEINNWTRFFSFCERIHACRRIAGTHLSKSTKLCAGGFEESLALCSAHNERVLTLSLYSRQRLEIMEPAAMQNFGASVSIV